MELLTFHVGDREFGVDLGRVHEIVIPPPVTRVPEMPSALLGIAALRGDPIPVVDGGLRLDGRRLPLTARTPIVVFSVVLRDQAASAALLVEAAGRKIEIDRPLPWTDALARFAGADACTGFAEVDGALVLILDVDALFAFDGIAAASQRVPPEEAGATASEDRTEAPPAPSALPALPAPAAQPSGPAPEGRSPRERSRAPSELESRRARRNPIAAAASVALHARPAPGFRGAGVPAPAPAPVPVSVPVVAAPPPARPAPRPFEPPREAAPTGGRPAAPMPTVARTDAGAAATTSWPEPRSDRRSWGLLPRVALPLVALFGLWLALRGGSAGDARGQRLRAESPEPFAPRPSQPLLAEPSPPRAALHATEPAPEPGQVDPRPLGKPAAPSPAPLPAPAHADPRPIPAPAPHRAPLPAPMVVTATTPPCEIHEVARGDTLWRIAGERLGSPYRWPELFGKNRDQIANPDVIEIHDRIRIPGGCASAPRR